MIAQLKKLIFKQPAQFLWHKQDGKLPEILAGQIPPAPQKQKIERLADKTNQLGAQPLAVEYGLKGATRLPEDVRSSGAAGDLYAHLVWSLRPETVVEFGSAFGLSGMYWMAGIMKERAGWLYSYELQPNWARIARQNISEIGDRFTLINGAFEDHAMDIPAPIDIAFVDGMHTREFILSQFVILLKLTSPGAVLVFDDIDFATGDMRRGWDDIRQHPRVLSACEFRRHAGLVEVS